MLDRGWHYSRSLQRLDQALLGWKPASGAVPRLGWLHTARIALGMTARQLAARASVTPAAVTLAQRAEANGSISLATLERYAAALDCELVYFLAPRTGNSFNGIRERRAKAVARQRLGPQASGRSVRELARALLVRGRSTPWSQPVSFEASPGAGSASEPAR